MMVAVDFTAWMYGEQYTWFTECGHAPIDADLLFFDEFPGG
jgi:hypothetical protein